MPSASQPIGEMDRRLTTRSATTIQIGTVAMSSAVKPAEQGLLGVTGSAIAEGKQHGPDHRHAQPLSRPRAVGGTQSLPAAAPGDRKEHRASDQVPQRRHGQGRDALDADPDGDER